ncbi:hypothetical protein F4679DRAFT_134534 [Xylaria curta]|nr:hypothetical protein F4679DRAFT_134534 [Xylaria curta]
MDDLQDWPTRPLQIIAKSSSHLWTLLPMTLLLLYIIFGIVALILNGRTAPCTGSVIVEEVSKLAPTTYPVIFALVIKNALQSIGRLSSERGVKIGTLHHFMTTRSLGDALSATTRIFHQSALINLSIVLWALSPIGSQASFRMLYTTQRIESSKDTVRYLDTGPLRHSLLHWSLDEESSYIRRATANNFEQDFYTVMAQSWDTLESRTDGWHNAKIPRIESLNIPEGPGAWLDTTGLKGADSYSSPLGTAIHELPTAGSKDLSIETSYIGTSCDPLRQTVLNPDEPDNARLNFQLSCLNCPTWNASEFDKNCMTGFPHPWCSRLGSFLGLDAPNSTPTVGQTAFNSTLLAIDIWVYDAANSKTNAVDEAEPIQVYATWSTICNVYQKHVEVQIRCEAEECYTKSVRNSQLDKRPESVTPMDFWASKFLPNGSTTRLLADTIPRYLSGPVPRSSSPANASQLFAQVTAEQFSARLGAVLNVYLQLYLAGTVIRPRNTSREFPTERVMSLQDIWGPEYDPINGLKLVSKSSELKVAWTDLHRYFQGYSGSRREFSGGYGYATTIANTSISTEIYKADPVWVTLTIFCSLTAITLGAIGLICELRSMIPNRFDSVLGLTYNNRDLGLLVDGSVLGTDERLRLLNQLEVRVGDVMGHADIGRIAFAMKDEVLPVRKERLYE